VSVTELLQDLIRFDTTNPPGHEGPCIAYLEARLQTAGIETVRYAQDPARPNLVARVPGSGGPPLLLQGHVDVVTTAGQRAGRTRRSKDGSRTARSGGAARST